jgi:DNA (cytosine-5)-methyltransferase 1
LKKIKLFEAFAGIGTQALALKYQGIPYESVGISEIDKFAITSYEAIHGPVKNYGDIKLMETIPECDIFTYSFPCQDLSRAGSQRGMLSSTRSGLVYEVLRLLRETENKPKVLLMENVTALFQSKFIEQFKEIQKELENLGYKNYTKKMNAKDYGVPQNRPRVFMVSILGEGTFEFPKTVPLEKNISSVLEEVVDPKFYITTALYDYFTDMKDRNGYVRGARFHPKAIDDPYAYAITTNTGNRPTDNFIKDNMCSNRAKRFYEEVLPTMKEYKEGVRTVIAENKERLVNLRKLTPKECWRLMGIKDDDFYKAQEVCSNTRLYEQAGNAIVVDVLELIFKNIVEGVFYVN